MHLGVAGVADAVAAVVGGTVADAAAAAPRPCKMLRRRSMAVTRTFSSSSVELQMASKHLSIVEVLGGEAG